MHHQNHVRTAPQAPGPLLVAAAGSTRTGAGRTAGGGLHRALAVGCLAACLAGFLALVGAPAAHAATATQAYKNYALSAVGGNRTQFGCLDQVWTRESGWNPNARNASSSAYGIPQFLDSTWASTGIAKTSNPNRQIDAGLVYIRHRYGTPCGAWAFWQAHHWY